MPANVARPWHVYFAYLALAVLFVIAVTNRVRDAVDRFDELFHSADRARIPFDLFEPDMTVSGLQPEAKEAGMNTRDVVITLDTRSLRGTTGYYTLVRQARPGDRLLVGVQSGAIRKDVSIQLRPF